MDYKINNLKDKVYKDFIKGVYGDPIIPSENEVLAKIKEITDFSYTPITDSRDLTGLSLSGVTNKFNTIIDDISILFDSIEDESRDVLDQLTNSLKEHNGVKRELKRVSTTADDIVQGKLGEEYLQYNFTESFSDVDNINIKRSDIVDTDAGVFSIRDNSSTIVNMNHYINRKLEFNVIENAAPILEQGFVGSADAESVLSKQDPRSITYRVKTTRPTKLTVATSLQLRPNGSPVSINSVDISVDSSSIKGFIRLYYQDGYKWIDVPGINVQEIKDDSVHFSFTEVEATHIKLEFIKDLPDTPTTNEYYVTIYDIAIAKSSARSVATLYSKPVVLTEYDMEDPLINNISCVVDADVPPSCNLKVYVAPDMKVSGQFVNSAGDSVFSDSIEAVDFDPNISGSVFLSDIMDRIDLSGLVAYRGSDFGWKELKSAQSFGNQVPEIIEFNNTSKHDGILNSLYSNTSTMVWGDRTYTGTWPPVGYTGLYISGWCNTSNHAWTAVLKDLVASGYLTSGINVATLLGIPWNQIADGNGYTYVSGINPLILSNSNWSGQWLGYGSGYPYGYFDESLGTVIRYGQYTTSINGWWRPYSYTVTPTGISPAFSTSGFLSSTYTTDLPDFYFNGLKFYKIYKFGSTDNVVDSSIKLYQFEERPVSSNNDKCNHSFRWKYKTSYSTKTDTLLGKYDPTKTSTSANFSGYSIAFPELGANEDYSVLEVLEVRQHNTNFVLAETDYEVVSYSGIISGVLFTPLIDNYPSMRPRGLSFDIKYNYRVKNKYLSSWIGFAMVSPGVDDIVSIQNKDIFYNPGVKVVGSILVEDLDNGTNTVVEDADGKLNIRFNTVNAKTVRHFKITIYCESDEESGFSAKIAEHTYFNPKNFMSVPGGVRFVSYIEPLKICRLSSLLYDTPMGNDRKCALIEEANGEKYIVVKSPSKSNFPGYIFNNSSGEFFIDYASQLDNKGHFVRRGVDVNDDIIIYTTGSSGNAVYDTLSEKDMTWNNGQLHVSYGNSDSTSNYDFHSTYGYRVHLEPSGYLFNGTLYDGDIDPRAPSKLFNKVGTASGMLWLSINHTGEYATYINNTNNIDGERNYTTETGYYIDNKGFLFYNTAENLPTHYSVFYKTLSVYDDLASRFLYKLELESDGTRQIVPKVRSIRFEINKSI